MGQPPEGPFGLKFLQLNEKRCAGNPVKEFLDRLTAYYTNSQKSPDVEAAFAEGKQLVQNEIIEKKRQAELDKLRLERDKVLKNSPRPGFRPR